MRDAVVEGEGECEVVVGLTGALKAVLMASCIVPRYLINVYLLWLGCRWLAATPSFGDLLLNAAPWLTLELPRRLQLQQCYNVLEPSELTNPAR